MDMKHRLAVKRALRDARRVNFNGSFGVGERCRRSRPRGGSFVKDEVSKCILTIHADATNCRRAFEDLRNAMARVADAHRQRCAPLLPDGVQVFPK